MPAGHRFGRFIEFIQPVLFACWTNYTLNIFCNDVSYEVQMRSSVVMRIIPYIPVFLGLIYAGKRARAILYPGDSTKLLDPNATVRPPETHATLPLDPIATGTPAPNNTGTGVPQDSGVLLVAPHNTSPSTSASDVAARLAILDHKLDRLFDYLEHFKQREMESCSQHGAPESLHPRRTECILQAAQANSDHLALTIHSTEDVADVANEYQPRAIVQGSKILHRRFDIGPHTARSDLDKFRLQVIESMKRARMIDNDCTLQFGSLAVLKYTEAGPTWWKLQEHWTPLICEIRPSFVNLWDLLHGSSRRWTITGFNLQTAALRATTMDESENLNILHHYKLESGEDVLLCKEPQLVQKLIPMFWREVYICASNFVEVDDGVTFNLQSEIKSVRRAYWFSVVQSSLKYSMWHMFTFVGSAVVLTFVQLSRGFHTSNDGLFPKQNEVDNALQRGGDVFTVGTNSRWKLILFKRLRGLELLIPLCLFVSVIPVFLYTLWLSTLWPLLRKLFPSSGYGLPRSWTTHSAEDISSNDCSAIPRPVEKNSMENIIDDPSPGAPSSVEGELLEDFISSPCPKPLLADNDVSEDITSSQEPTTPTSSEDSSINNFVQSREEDAESSSPQKMPSESEDFSTNTSIPSPVHHEDKREDMLIRMEARSKETAEDTDRDCDTVTGHWAPTTTKLEDFTGSRCPAPSPPLEDNLLEDITRSPSPRAPSNVEEAVLLEDVTNSSCPTTPSFEENEDIIMCLEPTAPPPVAGVDVRGPRKFPVKCDFSNTPRSGVFIDCGGKDECPPHSFVSVCGRRKEMEDAVASVPSFLSLSCDIAKCTCKTPCSSSFHFFGVYDGNGGSQVALHCADRMHHILAEEMMAVINNANSTVSASDSWDLKWKTALLTCFLRIDAEVAFGHSRKPEGKAGQFGEPERRSGSNAKPVAPQTVGSTAVVAIVSSSQLIVANCGDSRAVLSRGGHAIPLSHDHKPDREDEMARIEAAGGRVGIFWNGYRVLGVLNMSRAIGLRFLKPFVIAEPEVTITRRTADDECLILASDGVWDVLSNEEVCGAVRNCLAAHRGKHISADDPDESPAAMAAAAVTKLALARGSGDNVSVVVVDMMVAKSG